MSPKIYNKPFLDENQLLAFLKNKSLPISNEEYAKKILKDITYYRFKIYAHPFKNTTTKKFDGSKSFEDIESLYRFDDKLRDLLFSIIGRVEIKLRSKLNYTITKFTNNPYWYLDSNLFTDDEKHNHLDLLKKIKSDFTKAEEEFIEYYKTNYINDYSTAYENDFTKLPPFWIVSEIMMFGDIKSIYESLNKSQFQNKPKNELDNLANEFGAMSLAELNTWLVYIKLIRNRCAHHSRVWNTNYFSVPKLIQAKFGRLTIAPSNTNRIYSFIVVLNLIVNKLDLNINLRNEIESLMTEYPIFNEMKSSAGFPNNWTDDPFWN